MRRAGFRKWLFIRIKRVRSHQVLIKEQVAHVFRAFLERIRQRRGVAKDRVVGTISKGQMARASVRTMAAAAAAAAVVVPRRSPCARRGDCVPKKAFVGIGPTKIPLEPGDNFAKCEHVLVLAARTDRERRMRTGSSSEHGKRRLGTGSAGHHQGEQHGWEVPQKRHPKARAHLGEVLEWEGLHTDWSAATSYAEQRSHPHY